MLTKYLTTKGTLLHAQSIMQLDTRGTDLDVSVGAITIAMASGSITC